MATRSLNKVMLIGNSVRDPELRYTPQNTAVANFTIATNRTWNTNDGQTEESTEFTRCVAWGRLAEIVGEYAKKGKKLYVEGRLQTREYETKDGEKRRTTEVVADQILLLGGDGGANYSASTESSAKPSKKSSKSKDEGDLKIDDSVEEELDDLADDIPF